MISSLVEACRHGRPAHADLRPALFRSGRCVHPVEHALRIRRGCAAQAKNRAYPPSDGRGSSRSARSVLCVAGGDDLWRCRRGTGPRSSASQGMYQPLAPSPRPVFVRALQPKKRPDSSILARESSHPARSVPVDFAPHRRPCGPIFGQLARLLPARSAQSAPSSVHPMPWPYAHTLVSP